jgi:hypothetical protein
MSKQFITTPVGTAVLPFLQEEDKKYGGYKVWIRVDKKTAEVFKAKLLDTVKNHEFKTKNVKLPIKADEKTDGMYLIVTSSDYKPMVFDSKNHALPQDAKVGGGTELRVLAEVYPWEVKREEGIKLRLKQAQIIKLATGGSSGFDEVDDGFEVDVDGGQESHFEEANSALDI